MHARTAAPPRQLASATVHWNEWRRSITAFRTFAAVLMCATTASPGRWPPVGGKKSAPCLGRGFESHQNEFSRKKTWWGFTQRCPRSLPPSLVTCEWKELGLGEKGLGDVSPSLSRLSTDHTSPRPACCMDRICFGPSCGSLDLGTNYGWKMNPSFNSEPEEAAPEPPHHVPQTAPLKTARQRLQPLARLCFRLSCPNSPLTLLKDSVVFSHPEY